jgi:hypothetical protein
LVRAMSAASRPSGDRPPRWALGLLLAAGLALILLPVAFGMFDRAPKGARMLADFKPFMTETRLAGFQHDIREVDAGVRESGDQVARYLAHHPPQGTHVAFADRFPEFATFAPHWPPINRHMAGLIATIQRNLPNYQAMAALPSFNLFPWFFAAPGALLLLAVGAALVSRRWRRVRFAVAVLGIGLVLAPVAFQMFSRAPAGARMMTAFRTIETRRQVETIQGYFGTIGLGQGAIRLELVPALAATGLTAGDIVRRFPAVSTLDRRWVAILGDMTPMIGAMSDNVENYQALTSLPSFTVFPWIFVVAGLLVAAIGLGAGARPQRRSADSVAKDIGSPRLRGAR